MLDKFRETAITWDKANRKVYEPLRVSAGDNKGRKLSVQVVNGGVVENITGSSLSLFWETRDKAHRGLDVFTAVDATKGEFEIFYTTGMLSNEGVLNANLVLVDTSGRVVSEPFTITVFKGIDDNAIQSSDSFTALTEALIDISDLEQNYAPRLNDLTAQLQQTEQELSSQLAQKAVQSDITQQGYLSYGEIKLPSDFPKLPWSIYRDFDGQVKHNYSFSRYKNGTKIYVNRDIGLDGTGTGEIDTPVRSLSRALEIAKEGADPAYQIILKTNRFDRVDIPINEVVFTNKDVSIIPDSTTYITNHTKFLTWTADGAAWKANRSLVGGVCDLRNTDLYGVPIPFKNVATLDECKAESKTFYTDNVDVWVNTGGDEPDDVNYVVGTQDATFLIKLLGTSKLYIENLVFVTNSLTSEPRLISGDGGGVNLSGEFCAYKCIFTGGNQRINSPGASSNGVSINNLAKTYLFNCVTAYNSRDGFNYHYSSVPVNLRRSCIAFEFECISYKNGVLESTANNNATTAHEGISILRIKSIGYETRGPVLADVNGCYSVCIDCNMRDSLINTAYYFDNYGNENAGKAILINSTGKSSALAINGETGFDLTLENFSGNTVNQLMDVSII